MFEIFKELFKKKEVCLCVGVEVCTSVRNADLLAYCKQLEEKLLMNKKVMDELESKAYLNTECQREMVYKTIYRRDRKIENRLRDTLEGAEKANKGHFETEQKYLAYIDKFQEVLNFVGNGNRRAKLIGLRAIYVTVDINTAFERLHEHLQGR